MNRASSFLILFLTLLLAACASPTPTAPAPAATAPRPTGEAATTTPTSPPARATLLPSPTPLPPELQDLLTERDAVAQEMFVTLDRARAQNASQEQIDEIIRSYEAEIRAIEEKLAEAGVAVAPLPLPPAPPVAAKKEVFDIGMVTEDGVRIKGTYYRPAATDAPGVVLLHMLGRKRGDWDAFARQLQDAGYGVIAIDLRGHGESGGEAGDVNTTEDVLAAVDFLRAQAEVDPENIVLIGGNDGSWWALDAASKQPDIRAVALLTPGISYDKQFLEQVMADYGDRPLFIAISDNEGNHGEDAVKTARALDELASGPHELEILHEYGWGSGLLMQENGLAPKLLAWLHQVTGQ